MAGFLSASGPLARALPSFEPRPQQARMAQEVAAALASGRHLLIEAGTGIGKSIAYLLPAILYAMRPGPAPPEERRDRSRVRLWVSSRPPAARATASSGTRAPTGSAYRGRSPFSYG